MALVTSVVKLAVLSVRRADLCNRSIYAAFAGGGITDIPTRAGWKTPDAVRRKLQNNVGHTIPSGVSEALLTTSAPVPHGDTNNGRLRAQPRLKRVLCFVLFDRSTAACPPGPEPRPGHTE